MQKNIDILKVYEEELLKRDRHASKCAEDYAQYMYQERIFKQLRDDMLASLKSKIREDSGANISEVKLEALARSTPEWLQFIAEQLKVLREAGHAKTRYDNAVRSVDVYRSCVSLKKAEIERFGG